MKINSKSTRKELFTALERSRILNGVLSWLYTKDGACGSAKKWRQELLNRIRPAMIGHLEHVILLEWMVQSHKSFPSKNHWRQEFVKRLYMAAGL